MLVLDDLGIKKVQIKEQMDTLSDIKREMDTFIDLVKVKIALSNQLTNGKHHFDDDLAISNIELIS